MVPGACVGGVSKVDSFRNARGESRALASQSLPEESSTFETPPEPVITIIELLLAAAPSNDILDVFSLLYGNGTNHASRRHHVTLNAITNVVSVAALLMTSRRYLVSSCVTEPIIPPRRVYALRDAAEEGFRNYRAFFCCGSFI